MQTERLPVRAQGGVGSRHPASAASGRRWWRHGGGQLHQHPNPDDMRSQTLLLLLLLSGACSGYLFNFIDLWIDMLDEDALLENHSLHLSLGLAVMLLAVAAGQYGHLPVRAEHLANQPHWRGRWRHLTDTRDWYGRWRHLTDTRDERRLLQALRPRSPAEAARQHGEQSRPGAHSLSS